jgi:hypothetical protein
MVARTTVARKIDIYQDGEPVVLTFSWRIKLAAQMRIWAASVLLTRLFTTPAAYLIFPFFDSQSFKLQSCFIIFEINTNE